MNDIKKESIPSDWLDWETIKREKRTYWRIRRLIDILLSAFALVFLFPLLLLVSIAIVIDNPGNPIYVSERCGQNGKIFRFYKFRSMCIGADKMLDSLRDLNEADGPVFKIKKDPRITRVGRFIRATSIDELPQLVNILKGDMGIVGPRPPLPHEVACYTPYQHQRLLAQPGLTCYWQIQHGRNSIPFDQWVELDLKYIRESSLKTDLSIILKTAAVVLRQEGC